MNVLALAVLGVAAGAAVAFTRKGETVKPKPIEETQASEPAAVTLDDLFEQYGARFAVDPALLKAVAMVESGLNPLAVRNNPPHDVSVGLMQILCIPDASGVCQNQFPALSDWRGTTFESLKNPELNICIGARILSDNIRRYGFPRGLAVYNSWSARHASVNGPFPNDAYVAKVLHNFNRLKGSDA